MIRKYIVIVSTVLMLVGFATGIILQAELLKPGISFMSQSLWPHLLTVHAWSTPISLVLIVLSTVSFVGHKSTLGQWAIWLGFSTVPLLLGVLIHLMHINAQPGSVLGDTVYRTAYLHAYGTVVLLVALGGLSAMRKMKLKNIPLKISFGFAFLIATSGVLLTVLQASLGLNGMPSQYIDYPQAFAGLQFYSSIAAITCFGLSMIYVILLWHFSNNNMEKTEDVF